MAPSSSTSPWPWVEEDRSNDAPIPPVTVYDDRPAVKDLIERHSFKIDEVRSKLRENVLFDEKKHDDLWILRYLLSHKLRVKSAAVAAIATLEYRDVHQLDSESILNDWPGLDCSNENVRTYQSCCDDDAFRYCLPHPQRGIVMYMRLAGVNQKRMREEIQDANDLPFAFLLEWTFQWLDRITRQTGRLTQSIRIIDVSDIQRSMMNRENGKRNGEVARKLSEFYPQILAKMFICNAPSWVYGLFNTFRPFMPKRVAEKVEFCQPKAKEKDLNKLLPFLSEGHIPTRLGGNYETWPVDERIAVY
mmetsp:Transcript_7842/g.11421  ORF Transcript_7842/g.11421 Transcript_7842/m.11421 type:complete len:304 (-) Transcript_7842:87-998(-)|eukprot:CAMPEP_0194048502 /NCGR_PEP_ID=MMETSP0009_2-20130614/27482_1 /TAXON_ID=210454 /ORGANISM="Grammatophora oceanica, Strain CCMP 410" /LENGTH=303 /DNA_ID=CAMNT_0038694381 /DNA_START=50 /DNA_END=961 /DNA_ORIENTATION=+